jgi:hypothetical protein
MQFLWMLTLCFYITERARIEAQVKAAEAAAQRKLDEEMRIKREQEREAARLALRMVQPAYHFLTSKFICLILHLRRLLNLISFCVDEEDC